MEIDWGHSQLWNQFQNEAVYDSSGRKKSGVLGTWIWILTLPLSSHV